MYQQTPPHVATEWQLLYSAALSEPDDEKRSRLIQQTERAIGDRYHAAGRHLGDDEIREMAQAVWNLLELQGEITTVR